MNFAKKKHTHTPKPNSKYFSNTTPSNCLLGCWGYMVSKSMKDLQGATYADIHTYQVLLSNLSLHYCTSGNLACTTEWLRTAAAKLSSTDLLASSSNSETSGSSVPQSDAAAGEVSVCSPTAVLNQAYMDLLHWEPGKDYPEVRGQHAYYDSKTAMVYFHRVP